MAFLPKYTRFDAALKKVELKDNFVLKGVIGLAAVLVVALMFPRGEALEYEYTVGGVWVQKDLIAPFSFSIYKDEQQYEQEKREAAAGVTPVFERNDKLTAAQSDSLTAVFERMRLATAARTAWIAKGRAADSVLFDQLSGTLPFTLSESQWHLAEALGRSPVKTTAEKRQFIAVLAELCREAMESGIVNRGDIKAAHAQIALRRGTEETVAASDRFEDLETAHNRLEREIFAKFGEGDTGAIAIELMRAALRPNVLFNQVETDKLIRIAVDNVPRTVGFVQENERIVGRHERISKEVKLKLDSMRRARAERGAEQSHLWQSLGMAFHVAILFSLYGIYLFLFRKRIFHNNAKLTLIALLVVLECFFAHLSLAIEVNAPLQYLIFVPAASMLLTIIFDSRVAFYGTVTMAFLIAGIRGNDYSIALASLAAGALSVYTVRDIKHRTQIFRSLVFIFIGYAVVILALAFERFAPIDTVIAELTFALSNAIISPVLTYGLLIFFERVFRVTTDLTLLELSDFNQPLLRRLSEEAPGTFHHSITMGSLAEAAAEAIGANAILARVGAYYHDIGKTLKPEYFAENQTRGKSRHGRLSPRMSALIIASHVKEGIEVARLQGVPQEVLDFIPQHHGTTRISFFYDKALKLAAAKENPKYEVREEDFRYPGPKPQTKEAGIIMLADTVEASARAMEDPRPEKLEALIDNLMKARFMEGQLDECELTLRDLSKIKKAFLKILTGIHHGRVEYPKEEPAAEAQVVSEPPAVAEPLEPPAQTDSQELKQSDARPSE